MARKSSTFLEHSRKVIEQVFHDFQWARDTMIGAGIGLASLGLQAYWHLISINDWQRDKWRWIGSVVIPVIAVLTLHLSWRFIRAPWKVHQKEEEDHAATKDQIAQLNQHLAELTWPPDRPQLSFIAWGKRQPQFMPPGSSDQSLLAEHGFYIANDGGAALDITVEPFQITDELRAVGKTIARIEKGDKGFVPVFIDNEVRLSMWALDVALERAWKQRNSTVEDVLKDMPLKVPIAVVYKDYNENWYRSRGDMLFIGDVYYPSRIEFSAVTQERAMRQ